VTHRPFRCRCVWRHRRPDVAAPLSWLIVTIRVVLAEDDFLVRQGVARAIETQSDIDVVAGCADLDAALAAIDTERPDVVVTDIRMPPTSTDEGIRLATSLASSSPSTGVVVLSQYDEPEYVLALLESGTDRRAYLLKETISDVAQLVGAVRTVHAGGSAIDPRVVRQLAAARLDRPSAIDWLTPREREVLEAMARGLSNAGIGEQLGIGSRSVEKHISSIFVKLGLNEEDHVHRRVHAVLTFLSEIG
jgi:DNA-binding NarL/FixJ family response regulator